MIKITIISIKVDSDFAEENTEFRVGETAYYVIRESGKRLSVYYQTLSGALLDAWSKVTEYGLTLVEPW